MLSPSNAPRQRYREGAHSNLTTQNKYPTLRNYLKIRIDDF